MLNFSSIPHTTPQPASLVTTVAKGLEYLWRFPFTEERPILGVSSFKYWNIDMYKWDWYISLKWEKQRSQ